MFPAGYQVRALLIRSDIMSEAPELEASAIQRRKFSGFLLNGPNIEHQFKNAFLD